MSEYTEEVQRQDRQEQRFLSTMTWLLIAIAVVMIVWSQYNHKQIQSLLISIAFLVCAFWVHAIKILRRRRG